MDTINQHSFNMNTIIMWAALLVVVLTGGLWIMTSRSTDLGMATSTPSVATSTANADKAPAKASGSKPAAAPTTALAKDFKNATYIIDGKSITLSNGTAVAGGVTTKIFGNEAVGDLNKDGIPDVAFLVTQSGSGSGTFYYVVAALKSNNGYRGTNGILIGDRIAPQQTDIDKSEVIVNFADRLPNEPMTATPSQGKSRYFHIVSGKLVQI